MSSVRAHGVCALNPAHKPTRNRLCFRESEADALNGVARSDAVTTMGDVAEKKRTTTIQVRLTEEERAMIDLIAEASGLTASDWIRQAVRKEAAKLKK